MKYKDMTLELKQEFLSDYNKLCKNNNDKTIVTSKISKKWKISSRTIYYWLGKISEELNTQVSKKDPLEKSYIVKHKSTLFDKDGNVKLQWLKESLDDEVFFKELQKAALELTHGIEPIKEVVSPKISDDELVTFYPLPDLHWGVLIAKDESNHEYNYDLKIARKWILSSMKYLVETSPKSKTAVITDLGDFLHASDNNNRTNSGNVLDTDGRHYKAIKISFEATRMLIEEALKKHEEVVFYSIPGNHSNLSGIHLKAFLSAWFRNNPRVKIIDTHKAQQYFTFGKIILGFSHGHELRPDKAGEVMVYDNQENFSDSLYRYYHFGHYHTNKIKETPLCKIEIHKNIIPRDAWAESMGFRGNIGEAKAITYHKQYGEIGRNIFNIRMIED